MARRAQSPEQRRAFAMQYGTIVDLLFKGDIDKEEFMKRLAKLPGGENNGPEKPEKQSSSPDLPGFDGSAGV